MTGESLTPEQAPSEALSARLSDSDPRVGILGGSGGDSAPQAGTQGPDPQAVILDAISTALNAAGYWLPVEGKRAVVDAVLKVGSDEAEKWRRKAIRRAVALGRAEHAINAIRELANETVTDAHAWGDGYREALRDLDEVLQAFAPKEQP